MSEQTAPPAQDELAGDDPTATELTRYEAVQESSRPGADPGDGRAGVPTAVRAGPQFADHPPSKQVTVGLLALLLVASLVLVVAGLAIWSEAAPGGVAAAVIGVGGTLLIWHVRSLVAGSGRRTARISPWPWTGLVVVGGFGAVLGFALFDILTGPTSPTRIAMLVAGVVGLVAGMVGFVRDAELHERTRRVPVSAAVVSDDSSEPEVFFDPTQGADALRPRGVWPLPRRGSAADASLWEEPGFEDEAPPRRARRGEQEIATDLPG